ncbi:hypothetical protein [Mariniradius sediminis]|uniref:Outer membrane protein beta-barrel domain-containing protein n=1 Tax=Mariniradius sediminis TaxID=2909237 RepID=A0ABS9BXQ0_9BACT|nr:hypothetical protein [Mariniradius sediminis]
MKRLFLLAICLMPMSLMAQEPGIGLRMGEPFSITYKTFLDDNISIEGMFGSAGPNSASYYRNTFENNRPGPNTFYIGHSTSNRWSMNFRMAYHEDITDMIGIGSGYLLAYAGAGAQLRSVMVDYVYSQGTNPNVTFAEQRRNMDFGPEGFVGSEYYIEEIPLSVFAEFGLFMELVERFGHFRLQGAIGARYLF